MATVFISYCRESHDKARSLAQDFESLGHQAWIDQELTGGQAWWNRILAEIRRCDIFAFALEPDSLKSPACKREYSYAFSLGKSILPILITDGVSIDLLPPALAQIQYVDYRREDKPAFIGLSKALTTLPPSLAVPDPLPEPPPAPISYLGSLREQVEASSALSFDEQTGLVLRLKHGLREAKDAEDVRALLRLFRSRDDLYARVAEEIDALLATTPVVPVAPKPFDIEAAPAFIKTPLMTPDSRSGSSQRPYAYGSAESFHPPTNASEVSFKDLILYLIVGVTICVLLNVTDQQGAIFAVLYEIFARSLWSLPATTLLSFRVVLKRVSSKHYSFRVSLLFLVAVAFVVPAMLRGVGAALQNPVAFGQLGFLSALIPLLSTAAVLRKESATKTVSFTEFLFAFGAGLVGSVLIGYASGLAIVSIVALVMAVGYAILIVVTLWNKRSKVTGVA